MIPVHRLFAQKQLCAPALRFGRFIFGENDTQTDWSKAVANAEKIVGYPASYLSLRSLLSDEIANIAFNMRKLIKSNHPLLGTAKRLISGSKNGLQTRALIVLLAAKSWGKYENNQSSETSRDGEVCDGIMANQRQLAEITEIIHMASLIHRGVVNIDKEDLNQQGDEAAVAVHNQLHFGNKMSVLSGDYLLANASASLAKLGDTKVVEMMSHAISDIAQAEFITAHNSMGVRLPTCDITMNHWKRLTFLSSGSLLSNSCQAVLKLAGYSNEKILNNVYNFGMSLMYAYQIHAELQPYLRENKSPIVGDGVEMELCLVGAPVIYHISSGRPMARDIQCLLSSTKPDSHTAELYASLYKSVRDDKDSIAVCRQLGRKYVQETMNCLQRFPDGDAKVALKNFISLISI